MKTKPICTITAFTIAFGLILPQAGCQSSRSDSSDSRQSRLLADENYRLKGQIEQLKKQTEQLNQQMGTLTKNLEQCKGQEAELTTAKNQADYLTRQNEQLQRDIKDISENAQNVAAQLTQCEHELAVPTDEKLKKMAAEVERTKKEAEDSVNFVMTTVREESEKENKQLQSENEQLKAQIQKLQDELKQLKEKSGAPTQ
jgi:chromosome segregation ATPase